MTRKAYGPHGYGRYTGGCRCEVCRLAKADYMRERRASARAVAGDKSVEQFSHGTRYGYEERGCRCSACLNARAVDDKIVQLKRQGIRA